MNEDMQIKNENMCIIGERLRTQDNRCTANPMFCVQVLDRVWNIEDGDGDGHEWFDNSYEWEELDDPENHEEEEAYEDNPNYVKVAYKGIWKTVMVAFTEEGCKEHLAENGHNYSRYVKVRIYVDSYFRCPEMQAIRSFLMELPEPKKKGGDE